MASQIQQRDARCQTAPPGTANLPWTPAGFFPDEDAERDALAAKLQAYLDSGSDPAPLGSVAPVERLIPVEFHETEHAEVVRIKRVGAGETKPARAAGRRIVAASSA